MRKVEVHATDDGWAGQVAFTAGPDAFAYVPREIVVAGRRGADVATELFPERFDGADPVFESREDGPGQFFALRLTGDDDVVSMVHELRVEGVVAQPNHVLFAHDCCCGPHPAERWQSCVSASPVYATPVYATPVYATPVYATPVYATPVYATPVYATPVYATELQANGHRRSSARPADAPTVPARTAPPGAPRPRVLVLDTGLARDGLRPHRLDDVHHPASGWADAPDDDGDDFLDPAAGHGTFIAGLIEQLAPGCELTVDRVLSNYGAGDELTIAQRIDAAIDVDILSLSFGGYALEHMDVLAAAIRSAQRRGTVVVASAGNDGVCRPSLPAALPGVVGVAALGPGGPARFSNFGPWVRACAPGVDLVSSFFTSFDGAEVAPPGGVDPDRFASWARWSGSSFSAPVVAAALAREMQCYGLSPTEAVARVVDAPGLLRIPDFGTVVNIG